MLTAVDLSAPYNGHLLRRGKLSGGVCIGTERGGVEAVRPLNLAASAEAK